MKKSQPEEGAVEAPPVGVRRTVEDWAARKGYAQSTIPMPGAFARAGSVPRVPNPEHWKYAAARALCRWPIGAELTEAEFDTAIADASTQTHR